MNISYKTKVKYTIILVQKRTFSIYRLNTECPLLSISSRRNLIFKSNDYTAK